MKYGLDGLQKAAILLISLGPELSARVFKHLKEDEMEQLALEIASTRTVTPEARSRVLGEFYELCLARQYITEGGIEYAKEILERALGTQKALEILHHLTAALQVKPFDFVRKMDPSQLLNFIQNEHPQTIALIVAYLHPEQASVVLSALPPESQVDVAKRVALMDRTSPEVIRDVENVLEGKLASLMTQDYAAPGGVGTLVEILNRVDRSTEKTILESLAVQDPELSDEVKRRMFLFEDIVLLEDRYIQRILREVDLGNDLPLALKVCGDEVKTRILKNMSQRAQQNLNENMEYLGPVRLRDVEDAQQKIVNAVRRLEESGEIIISRGREDEVIV